MPLRVKDLADDYPLKAFREMIPNWEIYQPTNTKAKWRARRPAGAVGNLIYVSAQNIQTLVVKALLRDNHYD